MCVHVLLDDDHHQGSESNVHTDPVKQLAPDQAEIGLKHKVEEMVEHDIQEWQQGFYHYHSKDTSLGEKGDVEKSFEENHNAMEMLHYYISAGQTVSYSQP